MMSTLTVLFYHRVAPSWKHDVYLHPSLIGPCLALLLVSGIGLHAYCLILTPSAAIVLALTLSCYLFINSSLRSGLFVLTATLKQGLTSNIIVLSLILIETVSILARCYFLFLRIAINLSSGLLLSDAIATSILSWYSFTSSIVTCLCQDLLLNRTISYVFTSMFITTLGVVEVTMTLLQAYVFTTLWSASINA